jgi:hypothetical protein
MDSHDWKMNMLANLDMFISSSVEKFNEMMPWQLLKINIAKYPKVPSLNCKSTR